MKYILKIIAALAIGVYFGSTFIIQQVDFDLFLKLNNRSYATGVRQGCAYVYNFNTPESDILSQDRIDECREYSEKARKKLDEATRINSDFL